MSRKGTGGESRLVYSTGFGDLRKTPVTSTTAPQAKGPAKPVKVLLETAGRRGKTVTAIRNLSLPPAEVETLVRTLKAQCGTGGAVEENQVILQGDHRTKVTALLKEKGLLK